jgi:hypothetical protein
MKHLSEEELVAHVYAEDDRDDVAAMHLAACTQCTNACAALRSDLADMQFREPPSRDALYGNRVWQSISPLLPAFEAPGTPRLRGGWWRGLTYAAAAAAVVACAFIGGRLWEHKHAQTLARIQTRQNQHAVAPPPERVLVVVLSDHLDRSERLLVELKHAEADSDRTVSPLSEEARSLLPANRICRQNAKHADDPALATALDRLDHLLVQLADQPGGLNSATIARLQDEMNADGLLFKVRVLRSRKADSTGHTKGATI